MQSRYSESLTADGEHLVVRANGVPNHEYGVGQLIPSDHDVCEHKVELKVPVDPFVLKPVFTTLGLGITGVLKTGAFVYSPLSNSRGEKDVAVHAHNELPSMDSCLGHADPFCRYHHHAVSDGCSHDCAMSSVPAPPPQGLNDPCRKIGHMLDGFPLYSSCANLTSCYFPRTDSMGDDTDDYVFRPFAGGCDLDEANGFNFTGAGIGLFNENLTGYGYVVTDRYPFVPPKLRATPATINVLPHAAEISLNDAGGMLAPSCENQTANASGLSAAGGSRCQICGGRPFSPPPAKQAPRVCFVENPTNPFDLKLLNLPEELASGVVVNPWLDENYGTPVNYSWNASWNSTTESSEQENPPPSPLQNLSSAHYCPGDFCTSDLERMYPTLHECNRFSLLSNFSVCYTESSLLDHSLSIESPFNCSAPCWKDHIVRGYPHCDAANRHRDRFVTGPRGYLSGNGFDHFLPFCWRETEYDVQFFDLPSYAGWKEVYEDSSFHLQTWFKGIPECEQEVVYEWVEDPMCHTHAAENATHARRLSGNDSNASFNASGSMPPTSNATDSNVSNITSGMNMLTSTPGPSNGTANLTNTPDPTTPWYLISASTTPAPTTPAPTTPAPTTPPPAEPHCHAGSYQWIQKPKRNPHHVCHHVEHAPLHDPRGPIPLNLRVLGPFSCAADFRRSCHDDALCPTKRYNDCCLKSWPAEPRLDCRWQEKPQKRFLKCPAYEGFQQEVRELTTSRALEEVEFGELAGAVSENQWRTMRRLLSGMNATTQCYNHTDGTPCDDGSHLTGSDQCKSGTCSGTPLGGGGGGMLCANQPDGTPCDDGSHLTGSDQCKSGVCSGTSIGAGGAGSPFSQAPSPYNPMPPTPCWYDAGYPDYDFRHVLVENVLPDEYCDAAQTDREYCTKNLEKLLDIRRCSSATEDDALVCWDWYVDREQEEWRERRERERREQEIRANNTTKNATTVNGSIFPGGAFGEDDLANVAFGVSLLHESILRSLRNMSATVPGERLPPSTMPSPDCFHNATLAWNTDRPENATPDSWSEHWDPMYARNRWHPVAGKNGTESYLLPNGSFAGPLIVGWANPDCVPSPKKYQKVWIKSAKKCFEDCWKNNVVRGFKSCDSTLHGKSSFHDFSGKTERARDRIDPGGCWSEENGRVRFEMHVAGEHSPGNVNASRSNGAGISVGKGSLHLPLSLWERDLAVGRITEGYSPCFYPNATFNETTFWRNLTNLTTNESFASPQETLRIYDPLPSEFEFALLNHYHDISDFVKPVHFVANHSSPVCYVVVDDPANGATRVHFFGLWTCSPVLHQCACDDLCNKPRYRDCCLSPECLRPEPLAGCSALEDFKVEEKIPVCTKAGTAAAPPPGATGALDVCIDTTRPQTPVTQLVLNNVVRKEVTYGALWYGAGFFPIGRTSRFVPGWDTWLRRPKFFAIHQVLVQGLFVAVVLSEGFIRVFLRTSSMLLS